jgi:25S rRNA (cytosine2278-C5)-methyltransferase
MSREYTSAGDIVRQVLFAKASLKKLCSQKKCIGKVDYALACETIKHASIIKEILERAELTDKSMGIANYGVLYVMIHELLFGKKKIKGGGQVKRKIMDKLSLLQGILDNMMEEKGVTTPSELISSSLAKSFSLPRYVRINELKLNLSTGLLTAREIFSIADLSYDKDIPSLIALPGSVVGLGNQPLVKDGSLIIQDKASCFPSQLLVDEYNGGDVIDCCAAPGNKTSHLAALLMKRDPSRAIFAFEKDATRCRLLKSRMQDAGAECVQVFHHDFMSIDVSDSKFADARSILVDPSCSGSGIVRSLNSAVDAFNEVVEESDDVDVTSSSSRIQHLHEFQTSIVLKAMSFPNARAVVYSTCSVNDLENEGVVAKVLASPTISKNWELKSPKRLQSWKRRGSPHDELSVAQSACLIRCHPDDGMNGFFVALFVKKQSRTAVVSAEDACRSFVTRPGASESTTAVPEYAHCFQQLKSRDNQKLWKPLSSYKSF